MTTPGPPPRASPPALPPPPPGYFRDRTGASVWVDPRVARRRSRLLQLAVVGGSLLGTLVAGILDVMAGGRARGLLSLPSLAALGAGCLIGYGVGWQTFRMVTGRLPVGAARWGVVTWLALVTPAYLVAGLVATGVAAITAGVAPADLLPALSGSGATLLVAWIVLAPLTAAFAPSMTGRSRVLHKSLIGCSGTFWVAAFTTLWFGGSFMATLLVLGAAQAIVPGAYEDAGGSGVAVALMLVTWGVLWLGGSAAVYRLVSRLLRDR